MAKYGTISLGKPCVSRQKTIVHQQKTHKKQEENTMKNTNLTRTRKSTRRYIAFCKCCGRVDYTENMIGTLMPDRGNGKLAYMCENCGTKNRDYHSSFRNSDGTLAEFGTTKANGKRLGWELETAYTSQYARNILFNLNMIPTNDCSLDACSREYGYDDYGNDTCEYVSGIYNGRNIISKACLTVEKLIADGELVINGSCGTHLHISHHNMCNGEMGMIREYYLDLFIPLAREMKKNPESCARVFGRFFSDDYASMPNSYSRNDRYAFINVTNDNNIEFRINKFVNAKQYQALMELEVDIVDIIINNFTSHWDRDWKDKKRYPTRDDYRRHKAQTAGKKIAARYLHAVKNANW